MKIPVVEQHDSSDCGVACVVSICSFYGKDVTISELRRIMGTDAFGTSIKGIMQGLDSLGFAARSIFISMDSFANDNFTLPAIARLIHPDGTAHFVVIYRICSSKVTYMDPASDRVQRKTIEEFSEDFDGGLIMLVPDEGFIRTKEEKRGLLRTFIRIAKPHSRLFVVAIMLSVLLTVLGIVTAAFNKELIDEIIPYQENHQLILLGASIILVLVVQIVLGAFRNHIVLYMSQKIDIPLVLGYFDHVFRLPIGFFESRRTGDITTRFQDAGVVKDVLTSTALTVAIDVSMVLIIGIVLAVESVNLFLVTIVMAVLSALLIFVFKAPYRKLNRRSMEQNARLNSQIIESLGNIEAVKAGTSEEHTMDRIETEYIRALRIAFKGGVLSNVQTSLSSAITGVGDLVLLLYGGALVMGGQITLGTLIAFMSLSGYFTDPIGRLVTLQLSIQEADISLKRLSEIYDENEESESEPWMETLSEPIHDVDLKDVCFSYGTRPPVLKDVSLHIGPGERIALVGRSGCGKTTISKLLLRFYDAGSGELSINGRDIKGVDLFSIRRRIGCVPQNIQTFSGTVRENLLMGLQVSRQELDWACDIAGCTEFIRRLPAGYDTLLDETGGGLSGGEKQRLVIARALLRRPDLLILDEATSNMDLITERSTFDLMFRRLKGIPILIIAHRLSTVRNCDRIYVMEEGRIVESGTHDELMTKGGAYYDLWSSQVIGLSSEDDEQSQEGRSDGEDAMNTDEEEMTYE